MESVKVSVLLPVYNGGLTLSQAIASILSQDMSEFELIVIDDCSTDNSASIIR
ncbi:MAG: glycosyltransferase, partial [Pseudanabaena sp. M114S2SP2A07QC]|nr:glycosyltransferase [Pseudanabaena sp. M114S2SP2A07QC]